MAADDQEPPAQRLQCSWPQPGLLRLRLPPAADPPSCSIVAGAGPSASFLHVLGGGALARLPTALEFEEEPLESRECRNDDSGSTIWELALPRRPQESLDARLEAQAAWLAAGLGEKGWAVADSFLYQEEADSMRQLLLDWWAAGRVSAGQVGGGAENQTVRSDLITSLEEVMPRGFRTFPKALVEMQHRISGLFHELCDLRLGFNYNNAELQEPMFAIYPGSGAHYTRHYDAVRGWVGRPSFYPGQPVRWQRRVCTLILYLNPFWTEAHGGELRLYPHEQLEPLPPSEEPRLMLGGAPPASFAEPISRPEGEGGSGKEDVVDGASAVARSPGRAEEPTARSESVVLHPGVTEVTHSHVDIAPLHGRLVAFLCNARNPHEVLPAWEPRLAVTWWIHEIET